jgi:pimeloyl-ACP methyl ester carboxylesterase
MANDSDYVKPPSRLLLAIEGRAILELGAYFLAYPFLWGAPRGDGHPVLVLPGLSASDASTELLRAYLKDLGYAPHGWALGRNYGHHHTVEGELLDRLLELHCRYRRKVSIIGWSLGGVFARELAKEAPHAVRLVISLGSPIACCPTSTNAWRLYEYASGKRAGRACRRRAGARDEIDEQGTADEEHCPVCAHKRRHPPAAVPSTSIFSRTDGIVAWRCSLEMESGQTENIEVEGSHFGLGHNPAVLYAIADRLAQPEGEWQPFDRSGLRGLFYPDPKRGLSQAA